MLSEGFQKKEQGCNGQNAWWKPDLSVPFPSSSTDFLYDLDNPLGSGFNSKKVLYFHRINRICLHPTENQCLVGCFIPHTENSRILPPQGKWEKIIPCQYRNFFIFLFQNNLLGTQQNGLSDEPCLSCGTAAEQDWITKFLNHSDIMMQLPFLLGSPHAPLQALQASWPGSWDLSPISLQVRDESVPTNAMRSSPDEKEMKKK